MKVKSIPSIVFCRIKNKTKAIKTIIFHWAEGQHIIKWSSILPRAHRYYQIESSNVIQCLATSPKSEKSLQIEGNGLGGVQSYFRVRTN